jgi:hypothetical protein
MSSVDQTDEGLASGINNAASRIAQGSSAARSKGAAEFLVAPAESWVTGQVIEASGGHRI